ncbi:hypothetical protein LCGC14_3074320 [marine sediment metagenome]|uniref:7-cyano-7-deazaguanine synthase n=1 Tax=marine sediment metagenome TaxID=412755 RepID=A0A0F8Z5V4_9ZZZZ
MKSLLPISYREAVMKGICLCSGGLDSTLCLLKLLRGGHEVLPMFVDYNQWQVVPELSAFTKILEWTSSFTTYSRLLQSKVIKVTLDEDHPVGSAWGRTLVLVGLAAMWAYTHSNDYRFIALGNHLGDMSPDLSPTFINENLGKVVQAATKRKIRVVHPIDSHQNKDIGKELGSIGIPWNLMYSCYWYPSCQYKSEKDEYLCPGCRRKVVSMKAAGVPKDQLYPPNGERSYQSPLADSVGY